MLLTYRDGRNGVVRQRDVRYVAAEVQGNIIGSGDIDRAATTMNREDLRAWVSQTSVFQRLTGNAKVNVRQRGL